MKKQRVLVALDGSALGEKIMPALLALFKPEDAELLLVRVLNPIDYSPVTTTFVPSIVWDPKLLEQAWIEQRNAIRETLTFDMHALQEKGYQVELLTPVGNPVDEIVAQAEEHAVDLIAMATHGRTGFMRMVMGSVAEGVLRHAPVPVLLVRPQEELTLNLEHGVAKDLASILGAAHQVA